MSVASHPSRPDHAATTNPLAQLRAAGRKPVAAIIGATAGLVPVGVYEVGHYELTSWSPLECPKVMIVYAGLLFSALTVLGWSTNMFGSTAKALGFTLLLEGIMMTSSAAWLTAIALTYLVLINAVANGCRLALRDADPVVIDWASNLGRTLAIVAAATAAVTQGTSAVAAVTQGTSAVAAVAVVAPRKPPRVRRARRERSLRLVPAAPVSAVPELLS